MRKVWVWAGVAIAVLLGLIVVWTIAPGRAAKTPVSLPAGHYAGDLTIVGISPCEQFVTSGRVMKTDAFATVSAKGSTVLLEYEQSNTKAADYFETSAGTLVLTPGRMVGGKRHVSLYYFDMPLKRDAAGGYIATGPWIIQDACEGQAPVYQATLRLKPTPRP